jgi:hypothetical protein
MKSLMTRFTGLMFIQKDKKIMKNNYLNYKKSLNVKQ